MIVNVLLTLLWLSGAVYLVAMFRAARAKGQLSLNLESIGLGAATNFFDTLGIGSFAPTTAYLKLRKMVPDRISTSCQGAEARYRWRHHGSPSRRLRTSCSARS